MNMYKVMVNGNKVTTVLAKNENDAKTEAKRQLSKPGRCGILNQWVKGGRVVEVV